MAARKKTKLQSGQPVESKPDAQARVEREKRLKDWRVRVSKARKLRSDWEKEYDVEKCERYGSGQQVERSLRSSTSTYNVFRSTARTMKPNLLYTAPKFYVRPKPGLKAPSEETNAAVGEGVMESVSQQNNNLKNAAGLALWEAFFRVGVLKQCYDPKLEPNPQAGRPIYEEDDQGVVLDDAGKPTIKLDPLTGTPMVEPEQVLNDEVYHYSYVPARHMLLPDEGPDQSKWTWIGEEVTVDLDDAKEDSRFPKSLREMLTANATENPERPSKRRAGASDQDDKFRYVEIYDMKHKRHLIWADGQSLEDFLLDEPLPDGIEDHPYSLLMLGDLITGPEPSPWPVPFTHSWIPIQDDLTTVSKQVVNGAKRAARKGVYFPNSFENADEATKTLQSAEDMTFAKGVDPHAMPQFMQEPNLSPDLYKALDILMLFWRIITGQTGARQGSGEEASATEATFVERAANLRDADMQDLVSEWLSVAGKKMFQLVKSTLTMDTWIKLRGFSDTEFLKYVERRFGVPGAAIQQLEQAMPGFKDLIKERVGKEQWRRITREDLTFEADVTVVPGSARPRNLDAERRNWMEFLKILGQFPQLAMSPGLLKETAAKFGEGMIPERTIDELAALAQKMVEVQANQAGRNQGGANPGAGTGSTAGNPDIAALVAGMGAA